jgi:prepilin-type N-terminal cleavage/methylation domain-containing protein
MKIRKGTGRASFTLIEIMIVIAIIAILISIAVGTYFRVYVLADQLAARNDITQLGASLDKFKATYGRYPPSRIKLAYQLNATTYPNFFANPQTGDLDTDSVQFLTSVFGSRIQNTWTTGIDWTGLTYTSGGTATGMGPTTPPVILEGDQCLVFFLGGAQVLSLDAASHHMYAFQGFTNNPNNPMDSASGAYAYQGALFQFKGSSVIDPQYTADPYRITTALHADGLFPCYVDSYGHQPYAFFSSYNVNNGYNRYGTSDCPTLLACGGQLLQPYNIALPVSPYATSFTPTPTYQNPETYQIICAGRDGFFGPGSGTPVTPMILWTQGTALQVMDNPPAGQYVVGIQSYSWPNDPNTGKAMAGGRDDMSNFSPVLLGTAK